MYCARRLSRDIDVLFLQSKPEEEGKEIKKKKDAVRVRAVIPSAARRERAFVAIDQQGGMSGYST